MINIKPKSHLKKLVRLSVMELLYLKWRTFLIQKKQSNPIFQSTISLSLKQRMPMLKMHKTKADGSSGLMILMPSSLWSSWITWRTPLKNYARKARIRTCLCNTSITLKTSVDFYWQQILVNNIKRFVKIFKTATTEVIKTQRPRFSLYFKRIKSEIIALTFTTSGSTCLNVNLLRNS